MSVELPTISVTNEHHSESEASNDSYSNDMDYNCNDGDVTDVEDLISQSDMPQSRKHSINLPESIDKDNLTDIEDYNASDSENEEQSNVYPELKMSLREFLQHGIQEQIIINNEVAEKIEIKPGNFLNAQNLNGNSDYLTDCENYNTDSDIEDDLEKSACVDLDTAVNEPGKVAIADAEKPNMRNDDESDEYEDVSAISDISDMNSALGDALGAAGYVSEDEILEISGDEKLCQIACSDSASDEDKDSVCSGAFSPSLPEIDVTFVGACSKQSRNFSHSETINKKPLLKINVINEEVLTDIERLDDSAAEDDGFDDDDDFEKPIPRAVILAPGDDGTCQTDSEEIILDESLPLSDTEIKTVGEQAIPPPHREVVELREDKFGDTITNVMPMDNEFQFGIYNYTKDEGITDSEEYSCNDDLKVNNDIDTELSTAATEFCESEIITLNETLKPSTPKRSELHSNAESVTDVEEIYVAGTNRRKKNKNRTVSKTKPKYLDIVKPSKEDDHTDVEDMELSECGLPPGVKRVTSEHKSTMTIGNTADKCTDIENLTADDASDVSDADVPAPIVDENTTGLKEYAVNSANAVLVLETDRTQSSNTKPKTRIPLDTLKTDYGVDSCGQQHTDTEDIQMTSDVEDAIIGNAECHCIGNELSEMLKESCTVVHEQSTSTFNVDADKLQIKGMPETRDAHTDIEYVESDESAAKGGN